MAGRRTRKKKKKNIVRFRSRWNLNIGTVLFLVVAFYIAHSLYHYYTTIRISSYEVEQGTIEVNTSYTGLILRKEIVVHAQQGGRLDYYLKDNTKASNGTLVCSVDENGNISQKLEEAADTNAVLSEDNLGDIQKFIRDYVDGYTDKSYYATYNFKTDLNGQLLEAMNLGALEAIADYTDYAQDNQTFHLYRSPEPGIVAYYTDGLESVTMDTVTKDLFDQSSYKKSSTKATDAVESGQPVYKLITDENWQVIVPIDEVMKDTLQDGETVRIRFREDHTTAFADYTMIQEDNQDYLILTMHNSMIRYAHERYIDIQILLDQRTGLKIPNSSITTKTFELVPDTYFTPGSDTSSQEGLWVEHRQKDGSYAEAVFVPATVYYRDEEEKMAYISHEEIRRGDRIVKTGSKERFEVSKTAKLRGVYNINKGYAIFRQIDEIFSNNNYTIVKSGTEYGIMLYDHIALDGSTVTENQMINL